MIVPRQTDCSRLGEKPNVFVLHCGLDSKRVERACEKLDLPVSMVQFRREEVFAYYLRLDRPRPDLIIIRSHFRTLVNSLNQQKRIPTIVVSTHRKPTACLDPFIQADQGYEGNRIYKQLALAMFQELNELGDEVRGIEHRA